MHKNSKIKSKSKGNRDFSYKSDSTLGNKTAEGCLVPGRRGAEEIYKHRKHVILGLILQKGLNPKGVLVDLIEYCKHQRLPVTISSSEVLDDLAPGVNHQGVLTLVKEKSSISLEELIARSKKGRGLILALDGVQDPYNLGALIRLADAAGVDAVVMPSNRASGLNPRARKSSAGASEFVPVCIVNNLANALRQLKAEGYWILGTELDQDARSIFATDCPGPLVVVVGSERDGIRKLTSSLCDYKVHIPLFGQVQSLNVSQAASIVLFEINRQQGRKEKN